MSDSFIALQPDGLGKLVNVELQQTTAGPTIYTQRAQFVGSAQDRLDQIYFLHLQQLTVLRMINSSLATALRASPVAATEDDFMGEGAAFEDDLMSLSQDIP